MPLLMALIATFASAQIRVGAVMNDEYVPLH